MRVKAQNREKYNKAIMLYMQGFENKEIAKIVCLNENTIGTWFKDAKIEPYPKTLFKLMQMFQTAIDEKRSILELERLNNIITSIESKLMMQNSELV